MTAGNIVFWTIAGFIFGSVPFAFLVVKARTGRDVRESGSGNPGAMNAKHVVGWGWAVVIMILDGLKGLIPVGLAHHVFGADGWALVPIALAPILGHAYSPFLNFKGGKAVAVSYGIWAGVVFWPGFFVLAIGQALARALSKSDAWTSPMGLVILALFLALSGYDFYLLVIAIVNVLVMAQRYLPEFKDGLMLRWRA